MIWCLYDQRSFKSDSYCVFTVSSNGRRQMLVVARDLHMSYMATELERK